MPAAGAADIFKSQYERICLLCSRLRVTQGGPPIIVHINADYHFLRCKYGNKYMGSLVNSKCFFKKSEKNILNNTNLTLKSYRCE